MRSPSATRQAISTLRDTLASLPPGSAHQASIPPDPAAIFAPQLHASALDPQRVLVIGNRGVGKSFWSSVLTHKQTRDAVAQYYPRLALQDIEGVLGFHEDAGKDEGPSPSPAILKELLKAGNDPQDIWRAVLLKALSGIMPIDLPPSLSGVIQWCAADIDRMERTLRQANRYFQQQNKSFLLVFDALDRLGQDWATISRLTEGMLRLALDMRGYRSMRAKIFIRTDQANDDTLFRFADASKIRADAVKLFWNRGELFGLLYNFILSEPVSRNAFLTLNKASSADDFVDQIQNNDFLQEQVFYRIAGEYMGAGAKRGRTYTWIYDHLADAFGETSPRSFLTAIQKAAVFRPNPTDTVIDHNGIRAGVQDASEVRVRQLKEDYDWIDEVLNALAGLEVPCEPQVFMARWHERGTVSKIREASENSSRLLPLELEKARSDPEETLLQALNNIGVVEYRSETRINMPDIFRVEARIKRRGGVRPPTARRS